jgi:hypothetical protein
MLRTSTAVNVGLGDSLGLLALRALTIHRAERHKTARIAEVGWGRFEADPQMLLTCEDDEVVVVYQGELPISEHLRCPLPMPDGPTKGMIHLRATLAISPEVDPNNPSSYTRSGLEVAFRPSEKKYRKIKEGEKPPAHPVTKTFFSLKNMFGKGESVLRDDAHKWEPCMSRFQKFHEGTLDKPVFDVYYHHRAAGAAVKDPKPIPYALVVGIQAPKDNDFSKRTCATMAISGQDPPMPLPDPPPVPVPPGPTEPPEPHVPPVEEPPEEPPRPVGPPLPGNPKPQPDIPPLPDPGPEPPAPRPPAK